MQKYIGTKIISAEPMNELEAIQLGYSRPSSTARDGYLVVYPSKDGENYYSWSPKEVFESSYKTSGEMSFGDAIEMMRLGFAVSRKGWNGKGIFIELQVPDEHSKMTHPYIYIDTTGLKTDNPDAPKDRVPWLASQTDMLSLDWCVLPKSNKKETW